ncbi:MULTISPECIES: DUF2827 domain-containing protein [unclassified Caballeronia]|uniref:DUF2827 domain-containing protein n=1 Tax=unclassified Caballeronia TaxID=2646786 RepID=UPI0028567D19|nr:MULTISPECIES: DUF2827 domain-containing protein [unclassified Caballeronia]MDR5739854.1 DUF2827 domain-containing protein [Caballeronia sp. LZ016]MDR5808319.1 DUF2827 domain-containing protein [Caballeronia sp. LZ019]
MRIGISMASYEGHSIWSNGMGQNIVFLAELFQRLPFVSSVDLIDVGALAAMPQEVDLAGKKLRVIGLREATDAVDVIIELGGALDVGWLDLMRARGRKVVFYVVGQPYLGLTEAAMFRKTGHMPRPDRCDEVWLLSKDAPSAPIMRTLHRCDVFEVPYIWHPQFLEQRIAHVAQHGHRYGYRPRAETGTQALRIGIFEPNISVQKTSSIPMLVCDEAYRANRESVSKMVALNTFHMKDHPTLLYLANSLDLVRDHRALFEGRHDIVSFMAMHGDAIVSHQWANDQNYLYLDALFGGYPLIHNSPWLKDAGYYYPDFDVQEGARQLLRAVREHDASLDDYRARARRVIDAVDPFNPANLEAYAQRLMHLWNRPNGSAAR